MKNLFKMALFMVALFTAPSVYAQESKREKRVYIPRRTLFDGQAPRTIDDDDWIYGNFSSGLNYNRSPGSGRDGTESLGLFLVGSVRTNVINTDVDVIDLGLVFKAEYASFESSMVEGAINRFFIGAEVFFGEKKTKERDPIGAATFRLMYGRGNNEVSAKFGNPRFEAEQTTNFLGLEALLEYYFLYQPRDPKQLKIGKYSLNIPRGWFHAGILQINYAIDVGGDYSDTFNGTGDKGTFLDVQLVQFIWTDFFISESGSAVYEDAYGILLGYFDDASGSLYRFGGVLRMFANRRVSLQLNAGYARADTSSEDNTNPNRLFTGFTVGLNF